MTLAEELHGLGGHPSLSALSTSDAEPPLTMRGLMVDWSDVLARFFSPQTSTKILVRSG
jgi:hypothetical protein